MVDVSQAGSIFAPVPLNHVSSREHLTVPALDLLSDGYHGVTELGEAQERERRQQQEAEK
jgi:hypothetical protein